MPFPDLNPYVNLASITITTVGILSSLYLFSHTRTEKPIETEKTVDLAVDILDIQRYPLEVSLWRELIGAVSVSMSHDRIFTIGTFIVGILYIVLETYKWFVDISYRPTIIVSVILVIILALVYLFAFGRRYLLYKNLLRELGNTPEESSRWLMDHAEMSVCADYNYLLAKVRWSLKQMNASVITVGSNYVDGTLRTSNLLGRSVLMKVVVKADQDEPRTFIISVEISFYEVQYQFVKGKYINRFLDLMGSSGLEKLVR